MWNLKNNILNIIYYFFRYQKKIFSIYIKTQKKKNYFQLFPTI